MKLMERSSSPKTNFVKKSKNYADINLPNKKNVQRIVRKVNFIYSSRKKSFLGLLTIFYF